MNKSDLVKKLFKNKDSFTEDDLEKSTNTILNFLSDTLFKGDRIEIRNFGIFEVKPTKAKPKARNPRTNEEIFVPAHKKIAFKPGKILKEELGKARPGYGFLMEESGEIKGNDDNNKWDDKEESKNRGRKEDEEEVWEEEWKW